ncbi:PGF-CTERM-anchored ABC transporter substrate-binding protein [Natronococcus occultus]|uniref:ABC-type Fe3+-hydroxamate transport system, periplasmic component n=1 Tax=Natronococcus occultus SP4 TaxID=694430 RepID=L0JZJ3_9EURY|nr:PGF-CTERM-anchored ABC transporter substrate-binding protein [Natronococcus occultus]AGB37519.1 ABC-type Fe3+-hydroxamate transport system, periplasmic component [Natronococcus occultus SP4]
MRKSLIVFVAMFTALAAFAPAAAGGGMADVTQEEPTCEFPFEGEDATGETVTVEEEPDSVVALQPSDAQVMHEIGAEEKLDGMPVGEYTDYLGADEELDITEDDGVTPVTEEVIDRDPDVVLAANALEGDDLIDQLRDAGLDVYVFPTEDSLDGVAENVRLTGEIVGECDGAEDALEEFEERLETIEATVEDEEQPLAYYEMGDGFTAGEGTFQDELITTAGVDNLGAEAGIEGWAEISEEVVVEEDPEWIIYGESWGDEPPVSEAVMGTTAYQNEQFVAVNDQFMSQPGPLVVEAIEEIVAEVHPEAYAEAVDETEDETDDADEADADDTAADDANEPADDAEDDSIPGFGVPAVVAALVAVLAVLARRR